VYDGKPVRMSGLGPLALQTDASLAIEKPVILDAQHPYYDALELLKVKNKEIDKVKFILEKYWKTKIKSRKTRLKLTI